MYGGSESYCTSSLVSRALLRLPHEADFVHCTIWLIVDPTPTPPGHAAGVEEEHRGLARFTSSVRPCVPCTLVYSVHTVGRRMSQPQGPHDLFLRGACLQGEPANARPHAVPIALSLVSSSPTEPCPRPCLSFSFSLPLSMACMPAADNVVQVLRAPLTCSPSVPLHVNKDGR